MKKFNHAIPLIYLIFVTLWLRLINLGYSNYQGDEIKALYRPQAGQDIIEFLLSQRKGPVQFLITYLMRNFDLYDNELLMRLPFAVAGIFAVLFFYKFVQLEFSKTIAIYASLFMAMNGLFIAFARIVQYQSFVLLFSILTLYFLSLSTKDEKWRIYGLYFGTCFWGLSLLAHYDGIFIAPFVFYLISKWYKNNAFSQKKNLRHLIFATALLLVAVSIFYIPFFFSISESTKAYWSDRISRQSVSSIRTFMNYNTTVVFYIYLIFGLLGLFKLKNNFFLLLWFLFPVLSLETFIGNPGTHIFTYVLPLCILISLGLEFLLSFFKKISNKSKLLNLAFLNIIYISLFLFSHLLFIDNFKEYPWESKSFLGWKVKRHSSKNLFSFPYYRHWEKISFYLKSTGTKGYFLTNEKKIIPDYYIPAGFKNLEEQLYTNESSGEIYIIYIKNPQSHNKTILGKQPQYWEKRYQPVKVFLNNRKAVATIYRLPASDWQKIVK